LSNGASYRPRDAAQWLIRLRATFRNTGKKSRLPGRLGQLAENPAIQNPKRCGPGFVTVLAASF